MQLDYFEEFKKLLRELTNQHVHEESIDKDYILKVIDCHDAFRIVIHNRLNMDLNQDVLVIASRGHVITQAPLELKQKTLDYFERDVKQLMMDYNCFVTEESVGLSFDQLLHLNPWFPVRPLDLTYSKEGVCLGGHIVAATHPGRRMIAVRHISIKG